MADRAPMEMVRQMGATEGSVEKVPRIPVTITMMRPEVRMVWVEF